MHMNIYFDRYAQMRVTLFLMLRALLAYLRVFLVSASLVSAGEMHAIISVLLHGRGGVFILRRC